MRRQPGKRWPVPPKAVVDQARVADDAVTRHELGNCVAGHGIPNGAALPRQIKMCAEGLIARSPVGRNFEQRTPPNSNLKVGALEDERERLVVWSRCEDLTGHVGNTKTS